MLREEKLKAAKEKLLKFQKKKSKGSSSHIPASASVLVPTTIDTADVANPGTSSISAESFQELTLASAAAHIAPTVGPESALPISFEEGSNGVPTHPTETGQVESSEPVYTANEQYYYDLYMGAAQNCDMLASQYQESQMANQQAAAEIERLSLENQQLHSQVGTLKSHLQNILDLSKASSPVEKQNQSAREAERVKDLERKAKEQLQSIRIKWEAVRVQEQELVSREEKLRIREDAIATEQERLQLKDKELEASAILQRQEAAALAQQGTEVLHADENTQHWLDYYQKKCEELEQLNSHLNDQIQQAQKQPPASVVEDRSLDIVLQEVLDLKQQFKASIPADEKIAKIEESNRQIIRLLETTSVSASSDFCKAVVELSKTNNHLLHFVSRNIVMSSSSASTGTTGSGAGDFRSAPIGQFHQAAAVQSIPDTDSVRELTSDIPQQELVSSFDTIKRKCDEGFFPRALLDEFIENCLLYHFDACDLLRLDFFIIIKTNIQSARNSNSLKCLSLLTGEGRDLRHFEHDIAPLVSDWIKSWGDILAQTKSQLAVEAVTEIESLINFVSNLVKFSFIYLDEGSILSVMESLLSLCLSEKRLLTSSLGFVDGVLRYGVVQEIQLSPFTKILFAGCIYDDASLQLTESILKNMMVSPVASKALSFVLAYLKVENCYLAEGALLVLLLIYEKTRYTFFGANAILQAVGTVCTTSSANNNVPVAKRSIQLCLAILRAPDKTPLYDFGDIVDIFCSFMWIWKDKNDKFDLECSRETDIFSLHSHLLKALIDSSSSHQMSCSSLLKMLSALVERPSCISLPTARFMCTCLSNQFLWSDTYSYLVCFDEAFECLYYTEIADKSDIKVSLLNSLFAILDSQMFHYSSQKLLENLTLKTLKLLATEADEMVLKVLGNWVKISVGQMLPSEISLCIEYLLQACCGVSTRDESIKLTSFWDQYVLKNTKVLNIPHPATKSAGYIRRRVTVYQSTFAVHTLIQVFHRLANFQNCLCVDVFYWLCNISSWSAVCPPEARLVALEFISTLSCNSNLEPSYKFEGVIHMIPGYSLSFSTDDQLNPFRQDHYLFAALAILEFEPSYKILNFMLETLQRNLTFPDRWIRGGEPKVVLAIQLLFDKLTCMIMTEWSFSSLTADVPSAMKKADIFLSLYQILLVLVQFKNVLSKQELDLMAPALLFGLSRWPSISRSCMQGLHLCLYELPRNSIIRHLSAIILKISQLTSSNLALPNLEFLATLASLPSLHGNFTNEDYKRIFGIILTYLRQRGGSNSTQQSVFAYYVMQVWFLSLKLNERAKFVPMIISTLLANSEKQTEGDTLDENVELVLDMMVQHSYIDCSPKPLVHKWSKQFKSTNDGRTWSQGNTLVTIQRAAGGAREQEESVTYEIVFRRPVGMTVFYTGILNELGQMKVLDTRGDALRKSVSRPSISAENSTSGLHQARQRSMSAEATAATSSSEEFTFSTGGGVADAENRSRSLSIEQVLAGADSAISFFDPTYLILQFQPYPVLSISQEPPRLLGKDDATTRAISVLDRTPSIDLHKIGVVYVAPGQSSEHEILANSAGSELYTEFLLCLGQFVALSNNRDIYTGGLDSSPDCFDGRYGILFVPDQRLTQMIFHVTTLMPFNPLDPSCTAKKRHIGNDFVMIIWNEGGKSYERNTIPGQFNLVQILIEPLQQTSSPSYSDCSFKVSVWFRPDITVPLPLPVIVSGVSLGSFVRQISVYYNMIAQLKRQGKIEADQKTKITPGTNHFAPSSGLYPNIMWTDSTQTFHYDTSVNTSVVSSCSIVKITLSDETFHWNSNEIEHTLPLSQIIGVQLVNPKVWNRVSSICGSSGSTELEQAASAITSTSSFWMVFAYDLQKSKRGDIEKPKFRRILFSSNTETASTRSSDIVSQFLNSLGYFSPSVAKKKILLIANPFGGTNKALATYHKIVLPLLRLAGLEANHELITTAHRNHAVEIGQSLQIDKYRAAATISGDGVFHELLNGILKRPDWKESSKLPLGIIGSGTSNALGQNLDVAQQPLAVLALLKGRTQKMDVLSIMQGADISYSHLMVAWTLIADVDIESERFRKLGPLRMAIMVLIRLTNFRKYRGKLFLLPAEHPDLEKFKTKDLIEMAYLGPKGMFLKPNDDTYKQWPVVLDSFFQYFAALNMPWIATDYLACPHTLIDNGTIDLLYCEKISRASVLASFLDAERGVSMTLPSINHKRVKAFVLEPGAFLLRKGDASVNASHTDLLDGTGNDIVENQDLVMDVSGERYPYKITKVEVLPSLINIIVPAWLDSSRWQRNFFKEFPSARRMP